MAFLAAFCCLKVHERDTVGEWMMSPEQPGPSLFERFNMCHCRQEVREESGIELEPKLRGLAGVTLQDGEHNTAGSLQTMKWASFDPETRVVYQKVFGGFGAKAGTGAWTEDASSLIWMILMNLARNAGYRYKFSFSEDYRYADIDVQGNPCVLCCCCPILTLPCCPAWFTFPRALCRGGFNMRAAEGVTDGTHWERYNGKTKAYDLVTVYNTDGTKGPHFDRLAAVAPQQVMVTV